MSYDVHTKLIPSQALKVRIILKVILILLMIRQNALISHNSIITIFVVQRPEFSLQQQ